ncbi:tRNA-(ms[2]io[6]A)-hydroxylase [Aliikangiella coralliicola]|uniref:tRNA-(Ms[2]io[6]A)-hydroxylase n=1 Tax=Aliikangiella coralliicola TaxID=2592383 RepID=A0A545U0G3_9GAMM|nr:tRNA-(ms[2]io[6]A)-hydroxylase [Aliikangiella coralliicola]TQV82954.1 tRNA-(ms[2]io[6]A)-hydroxylase [Aliikangiella coralliicola]
MDISHIRNFLKCDTPAAWLDYAVKHVEILLVDHAKCEKKAASTALSLMFKYPERSELQVKMAQLAREEVLHFEQVFEKIQQRNIEYTILSPSRYAASLRKLARGSEPHKLVDFCIIGGIIEARSCERFASLSPLLADKEPDLARYYQYLLKSESRHYEDYLELAQLYSDEDISERVELFLQHEADLIQGSDVEFRFHSGIPQ